MKEAGRNGKGRKDSEGGRRGEKKQGPGRNAHARWAGEGGSWEWGGGSSVAATPQTCCRALPHFLAWPNPGLGPLYLQPQYLLLASHPTPPTPPPCLDGPALEKPRRSAITKLASIMVALLDGSLVDLLEYGTDRRSVYVTEARLQRCFSGHFQVLL